MFSVKKPVREQGQGLVEYAMILVLIAVVIILILTALGSSVTLIYAQIVGGLNGQSISGSGTEQIVVGATVSSTLAGPGSCNVTLSDVTVVGLNDGAVVDGGTAVAVPVTATGGSTTLNGTAGNSGIVSNLSGSLSGVSCPGTVSIGNTGYSVQIQ